MAGDCLRSAADLFDRERNEACTVQEWADGVRRCTPSAEPTVFADPGCTRPLGFVSGPKPNYFVELAGGAPARLYHPDNRIVPTPQLIYTPDGVCVAHLDSPGTAFGMTVIPPEQLVQIDRQRGQAPTGARSCAVSPRITHSRPVIIEACRSKIRASDN